MNFSDIQTDVKLAYMLLARKERLCGNTAKSRQYANEVKNYDIFSPDIAKKDYFHKFLSEFDENLDMWLENPPKRLCEGLVLMFMELNYFREYAEVSPYLPLEEVTDKSNDKLDILLNTLKENLK